MVKPRYTAAMIARIAIMGALLYASQVAMSSLPNIEIVTLLIVVFTKNFGFEGTLSCFVYVGLTALTWGFGIWWLTYLIVWPMFSLVVYLMRKNEHWILWALLNAVFGLGFGAIFAVPYLFVSVSYAVTYWIKGIPFDVAHCIGNFIIAIVLGKLLDEGVKRAAKYVRPAR